jgi:hypothetical protein
VTQEPAIMTTCGDVIDHFLPMCGAGGYTTQVELYAAIVDGPDATARLLGRIADEREGKESMKSRIDIWSARAYFLLGCWRSALGGVALEPGTPEELGDAIARLEKR